MHKALSRARLFNAILLFLVWHTAWLLRASSRRQYLHKQDRAATSLNRLIHCHHRGKRWVDSFISVGRSALNSFSSTACCLLNPTHFQNLSLRHSAPPKRPISSCPLLFIHLRVIIGMVVFSLYAFTTRWARHHAVSHLRRRNAIPEPKARLFFNQIHLAGPAKLTWAN